MAVKMPGVMAGGAEGGWLTAILRPAGALDEPAACRLCESVGRLAACSDMVVVNLTATSVSCPRALARRLLPPARRFDQAGQCLLVIGASAELVAELERNAVPVVTLAADALPPQVGSAPPASPALASAAPAHPFSPVIPQP
jgi:hypothetical protein